MWGFRPKWKIGVGTRRFFCLCVIVYIALENAQEPMCSICGSREGGENFFYYFIIILKDKKKKFRTLIWRRRRRRGRGRERWCVFTVLFNVNAPTTIDQRTFKKIIIIIARASTSIEARSWRWWAGKLKKIMWWFKHTHTHTQMEHIKKKIVTLTKIYYYKWIRLSPAPLIETTWLYNHLQITTTITMSWSQNLVWKSEGLSKWASSRLART